MQVVLTAGKKYKCLVTKPEHLKEDALLGLWRVLENDLSIDFNCGGTMMCLREQEENRLDFSLLEYFIFIDLTSDDYTGFAAHQDIEDYFDLNCIIINDDALFKYDIKIEE